MDFFSTEQVKIQAAPGTIDQQQVAINTGFIDFAGFYSCIPAALQAEFPAWTVDFACTGNRSNRRHNEESSFVAILCLTHSKK